MITDAIFNLFFGVIEAAFILLPSGDGIVMPEAGDWSMLAVANIILPIDVFLNFFGIAVGIMTAGLAYWGVMKAVNLIRGSGA